MRSKIARLLTLVLVFLFQFSFAQELTVKGIVTDGSQNPLPGATVVKEGTSEGISTGLDGEYSIKAKKGDKLTFSFIGMKTQTVIVNNSQINVVLQEDSSVLNEVVIATGYTTSVKAKSNIAAQVVSSETIQNRPNQSFVQTLQGQVAGLNIQTGSGEPGAASTIIIRGLGTINGSTEPLFVIDGVQMGSSAFRSLNPNEIESVNVLKDAGATAVYGNRGANGVIVVTTKRGGYETPLTFNYIGSTGVSFLQSNDYNVMNSKQILTLENQLGLGRGRNMTESEIANYNVNTDWKDIFLRTGLVQNHTLNLQSGGKSLSNFTSFGFSETEGIVQNSDLMKFNFRNNLNGKSKKENFKYGMSTNINYSKRNTIGNVGTGGVNQNLLLGSFTGLPYISPNEYTNSLDLYNLYQDTRSMSLTPLFLMDKMRTYNLKTEELKAILNFRTDLKLTEGLNFLTNFGVDYTHSTRNSFEKPGSFNALLFLENGQEYGGTTSFISERQFYTNMNAQLKYSFDINDVHSFDISAFTEYYKGHFRSFGFTKEGLNPINSAPDAGTGFIGYDGNPWYVPSVSATALDAGLFSYFGTLDYDYDTRFGVSGTFRRDASYRFNSTNRWGTFWSVAGRWNISSEEFMKDTVFNQLKLRGSYGVTGNQQISGSSLFDAPNLSLTLYGTGTGYGLNNGTAITQLANNFLQWEVSTQANIGLDFEVFNSRLRGSLDVYTKEASKLFLDNPISYTNGFSNLNVNKGSLKNTGLEAQVAYDVVKGNDFRFTVNGNLGYNKNEVTDLNGEETTWDGEALVGLWVGKKAYEYYTLKYAGVNPVNGNALFLDRNGNYTETPDMKLDRRFSGANYLPEVQGGFGFDLDYKGWYLTTLFTFVSGIDRYDYDYEGLMDGNSVGMFNVSTDLLNAWTPSNTQTTVPRIGYSNQDLVQYSDRFLVDASYIRLRNISLGYNFNKKSLENTAFSGLKVFAMAENLYTWSKWRGWDAESNRAADQYAYPTPRTITVGLEVQF